MKTGDYDTSKVTRLTGLEPVRKRPTVHVIEEGPLPEQAQDDAQEPAQGDQGRTE